MTDVPPPPSPDRLDRRQLLVRGGLGGAALLGAAALGRGTAAGASPGGAVTAGGDHAGHSPTYQPTGPGDGHVPADLERLGLVSSGYGHGPAAPRDLTDDDVADLTSPPAPDDAPGGRRRRFELPIVTRRWAVADGASIEAWTYAGRLPGPTLRATEGDQLEIEVGNHTSIGHNLHLHGSHDPQMDGWEPIPPGESFTYRVEATPAGLHPYHCHLFPYGEHIRRGLYGALIVDPPNGREPATEVMLTLGGFDLTGDGRSDVYGWNGIAGLYDRHPIVVEVDALVRVYLCNLVEDEPLASFHLHAQTFDVYRSGTGTTPDEHTDVVTLGQGERAILEFRLPRSGRYMFHPHQHRMAERGAMGWFTAV